MRSPCSSQGPAGLPPCFWGMALGTQPANHPPLRLTFQAPQMAELPRSVQTHTAPCGVLLYAICSCAECLWWCGMTCAPHSVLLRAFDYPFKPGLLLFWHSQSCLSTTVAGARHAASHGRTCCRQQRDLQETA